MASIGNRIDKVNLPSQDANGDIRTNAHEFCLQYSAVFELLRKIEGYLFNKWGFPQFFEAQVQIDHLDFIRQREEAFPTLSFRHDNRHIVVVDLCKITGLDRYNPLYTASRIYCRSAITNLVFPLIHELIVSGFACKCSQLFLKTQKKARLFGSL